MSELRFASPLILLFLFLPSFSHAALLINEVAWMGSVDSANDEWIELYNDDNTPVDIDGWTLNDGGSLNVDLAGTIGAGEYAVLERTDDNSAPGTAFLIYTGALGNDGRILTLRRADSSVEDQVDGGENWANLGGDNTTKETAQRTSTGWVTAPGTPGYKNAETSSTPPEDAQAVTSQVTDNTGTAKDNKQVSLVVPDNELKLGIIAPDRTYVDQEVSFTVEPSGIGDALVDSTVYTWNFGDAYSAAGKSVTHKYMYPGTYAVVTEGTVAHYDAKERHMITVLPVTLSLTKTARGDVIISNNAPYEIDMSGFILRGDKALALPTNSVLLPRTSLTITSSRFESTTNMMVALYDTEGTLVASLIPNKPVTTLTTDTQRTLPKASPQPVAQAGAVSQQVKTVMPTTTSPKTSFSTTSQTASAGSSDGGLDRQTLVYIGFVGLLVAAILGLYARKSKINI